MNHIGNNDDYHNNIAISLQLTLKIELNLAATSWDKYVSVVPESTIQPLPSVSVCERERE